MSDQEEGREAPSRGNEWEVVSLTASAYAAAPGPGQVELNDDDQEDRIGEDKEDTSEAMFMSRHFVFPPSQHENLPLVPEKTETPDQQGEQVTEDAPEFVPEEGGISNTKDGENWDVKALSMSDEFPGIQFVDDKGKSLSVIDTEFEEGMALLGLNLVDEEQSRSGNSNFSSVHSEATIGGFAPVENTTFVEASDPSEGLDSNIPLSPKHMDEDDYDSSDLPCEAWWKRTAASLYAQATEANAVWSIFIAAAVMGLVIIGQRWQRERWQVLQQKLHFGDEKMSKMLGPLSRLKDVIVGGNRRGTLVRGSTTSQR